MSARTEPAARPAHAARSERGVDRWDREADVLKAHMRDGRVAVLRSWAVHASRGSVSGEGVWLDADRRPLEEGAITVPTDSVAIFETSSRVGTEAGTYFLGLTVISGAVTVACALLMVRVPSTKVSS